MTDHNLRVSTRPNPGTVQRVLTAIARRGCDITAVNAASSPEGGMTIFLTARGQTSSHVLVRTLENLHDVHSAEVLS